MGRSRVPPAAAAVSEAAGTARRLALWKRHASEREARAAIRRAATRPNRLEAPDVEARPLDAPAQTAVARETHGMDASLPSLRHPPSAHFPREPSATHRALARQGGLGRRSAARARRQRRRLSGRRGLKGVGQVRVRGRRDECGLGDTQRLSILSLVRSVGTLCPIRGAKEAAQWRRSHVGLDPPRRPAHRLFLVKRRRRIWRQSRDRRKGERRHVGRVLQITCGERQLIQDKSS